MIISPLRHLEDIRLSSLKTALQHLLTDPAPEGEIRDYYYELLTYFYTEDARAMVEFLNVIDFAGPRRGPTERWRSFATLPEAERREHLKAYVDAAFEAPDGESVSSAMKERRSRSDRIQWFVDKHDLNRSTTATYAERIYRTVQGFLVEHAASDERGA